MPVQARFFWLFDLAVNVDNQLLTLASLGVVVTKIHIIGPTQQSVLGSLLKHGSARIDNLPIQIEDRVSIQPYALPGLGQPTRSEPCSSHRGRS